ncbi:MAG TPA: DUF559 domain-containing protein [Chitinophagaceae bacterium]|nr:DUF559 domain-containing protein [Chitinophagaceae bacterium]
MHYHHPPDQCVNCNYPIHSTVLRHSINHLGYALCITCQEKLRTKLRSTSRETLKLYFSLKKRGIPAELEKSDGYKRIDIAIVPSKVNIEVDGPQHTYNPRQALADLKRTYHSYAQGYFTLRIPNALVAYNLEETVDYITEILHVGKN